MKPGQTNKILWVTGVLIFLSRFKAFGGNAPSFPPGFPADVDHRGQNLPKGMRNNNPGNLKYFIGNQWQGQVGSDGTFSIFEKYKWGIRAMLKDIRGDYWNKGKHTLREIIMEFAPNSENDSMAYINFVANRTGINPNVPFQDNYQNWKKICLAMTRFENGRDAVTPAQFDQVWLEFGF